MSKELDSWEGEGGAAIAQLPPRPGRMTGTPAQVEWAGRIKSQVDSEFARVAASFQSVAAKQSESQRAHTAAIIGILEKHRAAVMGRDDAGYFIREWQEIDDQVRQLLAGDPQYQEIKAARKRN
jgi:hypothetical protein